MSWSGRDSLEDLFTRNTVPGGCNFSRTFSPHPSETLQEVVLLASLDAPVRFSISQTLRSDLVWRITFPEILSRYLQKGVSALLARATSKRLIAPGRVLIRVSLYLRKIQSRWNISHSLIPTMSHTSETLILKP